MLQPHYILDSHIHLFDASRAEGIPWPVAGDLIYQTYLADDVEKALTPLMINKAIAIEASAWFSDNQWLLNQVNQSDFYVGCVGNLDINSAEFSKQFEQFKYQEKYLGIRYGNLWGRNLKHICTRQSVLQHLKQLAQANKSLDVANPDIELLEAVLSIKQQLPELSVIIDHLPNIQLIDEQSQYLKLIQQLARMENTYVKFSEIIQLEHAQRRFDVELYHQGLDRIVECFGVSKIMFGSDYPNSEYLGPVTSIMQLVQDYCEGMSQTEVDQLFYQTAIKAYSLTIEVEAK